jgi:hypothetical protein
MLTIADAWSGSGCRRQNLLGEEPHRFLDDLKGYTAEAERGGEFEITDKASPLLERDPTLPGNYHPN